MNIATDLMGVLSKRSKVRANESMARHTSMRVGGPAETWVEPWDDKDLARLLHWCHVRHLPVTMIGRGTNLLVRDGGIPGVVVQLGSEEFTKITVDGDRIFAGSGARLKSIVGIAKRHDLGGFEFLEGIPGSLGGALRMNAGAMGRATFDVVEWVRYVSMAGEIYDAEASSLPVTYRSCATFNSHVAIAAILSGQRTSRGEIDRKLHEFETKRWTSQPKGSSAGCIFKNPGAIPAGKLIEELGLKGTRVGGACVSDVHGNFIVNDGGATAGEVLQLIEVVRARAREARGIELQTEVMILGKD